MENTFSSKPEYIATKTAQTIQALIPTLSNSEARVAQYILLNLDSIAYETGASIAEKASVSQITVSRFLKRAGFKGIASLKSTLQKEFIPVHLDASEANLKESRNKNSGQLKSELQAMVRLYEQFETEEWDTLVRRVSAANKVYVTGFQSIRGAAEDFARRLLLARNNVQYLSPHDGMLAEWIDYPTLGGSKYDALVIFDVVPYAGEGQKLCQLAQELGIQLVIITDEFCHWARQYNACSIYAKSKSGLFLESTWGLVLASNVLVDAVANKSTKANQRSKRWQDLSKELKLF
ncbi:MurR/RpiR family transcriptional regulator [Marinomonas mediterranea]|uniref:MurR/RpiR family transcriptional regulator n=1 Tax=Marinomonas mediterranea TaxID=119864 RepID=UPI00234913A2|nr:MurR/RpiR family transcriptional regulator [Marinomonas mediterranea]WCN12945.1 MurR/RpiR family transcriptional regulator [Marinomonas mediterranea]